MEYPKALYLRGWADLDACVTVDDAAQEAAARGKGYRHLAEAVEAVAPPAVDEDSPEAPKRRGRHPKAVAA
jgi:hypothetical protein